MSKYSVQPMRPPANRFLKKNELRDFLAQYGANLLPQSDDELKITTAADANYPGKAFTFAPRRMKTSSQSHRSSLLISESALISALLNNGYERLLKMQEAKNLITQKGGKVTQTEDIWNGDTEPKVAFLIDIPNQPQVRIEFRVDKRVVSKKHVHTQPIIPETALLNKLSDHGLTLR